MCNFECELRPTQAFKLRLMGNTSVARHCFVLYPCVSQPDLLWKRLQKLLLLQLRCFNSILRNTPALLFLTPSKGCLFENRPAVLMVNRKHWHGRNISCPKRLCAESKNSRRVSSIFCDSLRGEGVMKRFLFPHKWDLQELVRLAAYVSNRLKCWDPLRRVSKVSCSALLQVFIFSGSPSQHKFLKLSLFFCLTVRRYSRRNFFFFFPLHTGLKREETYVILLLGL